MRGAVCVTLEGDCRNADDRRRSELLFQPVIFCLTLDEAELPAVIVDHDRDMILMVEGRCASLEGGIVELPLRRPELPDQLGEVAPVLFIAGTSAFRGEV